LFDISDLPENTEVTVDVKHPGNEKYLRIDILDCIPESLDDG
jgi:hypothetical protein